MNYQTFVYKYFYKYFIRKCELCFLILHSQTNFMERNEIDYLNFKKHIL